MYRHYYKRIFDVVMSLFGLIIISPLFVLICGLLFVANKSTGVFFFQSRPGMGEKVFRVIKFKTMNNKLNSEGHLLPDNERITAVGRVVRSLSLDEIPQLINVLKGDMSLVGPRPLLVSYLSLYTSEQAKRHKVRPGITGWAQVNGRNTISWEQKFKLDVWYVDNLSFWLDIKILILTLIKVLYRDGINASELVTMEPFKGRERKENEKK